MKSTASLVLGLLVAASALTAKADYSIQIATTTSGTSPNAVFDVDGVTKVDNTFFGQIAVNGTFLDNIFTFGQNGATPVSALNGYLSAGTLPVTSATLFGGSTAAVQLYAFKGAANYAAATTTIGAKIGSSASAINVTLGGLNQAGDTAFTVPNLAAMPGFTLSTVVPEPATIALGLFGAAGLLIRRRK